MKKLSASVQVSLHSTRHGAEGFLESELMAIFVQRSVHSASAVWWVSRSNSGYFRPILNTLGLDLNICSPLLRVLFRCLPRSSSSLLWKHLRIYMDSTIKQNLIHPSSLYRCGLERQFIERRQTRSNPANDRES